MTFTLRTATQAAIFDLELKGQFSDGMWENSRPSNGWEAWCMSTVVVGPDVGRDFYAVKDNYDVTSKFLRECVGKRMLQIARLAQEFGYPRVQDFDDFTGVDEFGMPPEHYAGPFWDERRAKAVALGQDFSRALAICKNETAYTEKNLVSDLREIKKAMKIFRNE